MERTVLQENICREGELQAERNSQVEKVLFPAHQEGEGALSDVGADDAGISSGSGQLGQYLRTEAVPQEGGLAQHQETESDYPQATSGEVVL